MKIDWDEVIRSLVLVRLGQELGCDSKLARAVHDSIECLATVASLFLG